jgi:hypothetical protein
MQNGIVYKFYKDMPAWAKGLSVVIVLAGVSLAGYRIYKVIQNKKLLEGSKKETDATRRELERLNSNSTTRTTLSQAQFSSLANKIFAAMDGYGTDNKAIIAAMANLNNDADVLALINAYGIRKISSGRANPMPDFEGTLSGALTEEMPQTGYGILNYALLAVNPIAGLAAISNGDIGISDINKLFATKNISYRF